MLDCRNWIWRPQVKNHLSGGAAPDRSSLFDGTCLFAQGARSKCARGVRTQQPFRRNISLCARSEIQVCSQRANGAVLSHEHVVLLAHGEKSNCVPGVRTQQVYRRNMSLCARREIQVCSQRANAAVLSHEHVCLRTERDPSVLAA